MTDSQKREAAEALYHINRDLCPRCLGEAVSTDDGNLLYLLAEDLFVEARRLLWVAAHMPGHPYAVRIFESEDAARAYMLERWGRRHDVRADELYLDVIRVEDPAGWAVRGQDICYGVYFLRESGHLKEAKW